MGKLQKLPNVKATRITLQVIRVLEISTNIRARDNCNGPNVCKIKITVLLKDWELWENYKKLQFYHQITCTITCCIGVKDLPLLYSHVHSSQIGWGYVRISFAAVITKLTNGYIYYEVIVFCIFQLHLKSHPQSLVPCKCTSTCVLLVLCCVGPTLCRLQLLPT